MWIRAPSANSPFSLRVAMKLRKYRDSQVCEEVYWVPLILAVIGSCILFALTVSVIQDTIVRVSNPEYAVIQDIIDMSRKVR